MARYCGSCGTEVDDGAAFCPTCGQPIEDGEATELPAAPAWPDPAESDLEPAAPAVPHAPGAPDRDPWAGASATHDEFARSEPRDEPAPAVEAAPTRVEPRPAPPDPESQPGPEAALSGGDRGAPAARRDAPPPAQKDEGGRGTGIDLPITMPVTLSGWLIGAGSAVAALGIVLVLLTSRINIIDLLLLLALAGIAATVFLATRLPGVPQLRLITLVVVLVAFGVALDRLGFRAGGIGELLLFLGTAAAAIGAVLVELGKDQPLGPQR